MAFHDSMADVVIVGGGIMGCAAAYHLAKAGVGVSVFEKGQIAGEQSGRAWGFVRQQRRDPAEMPLMMHSNRLWQRLESELGADIEWTQGGVLAAPGDEETWTAFRDWVQVSDHFGLETRILSGAEVERMLPQSTGRYLGGIFTPSDGHAEPRKATRAFADAARRLGAEFHEHTGVVGVLTAGGRVIGVETERGIVNASIVILAAGSHSSRLARSVGLKLPIVSTRQTVIQTTPTGPITRSGVWAPNVSFRQKPDGTIYVGRSGVSRYDLTVDSFRYAKDFLPMHLRNGQLLYARVGGELLEDVRRLVSGHDKKRLELETAGIEPQPVPGVAREGLRRLHKLLPQTRDTRILRAWAGIVDQTPDTVPIIDAVRHPDGLIVATGFSGHGLGLGPAVGEVLRDLVIRGVSKFDLTDFRIERFSSGRVAKASHSGDMAARGQA